MTCGMRPQRQAGRSDVRGFPQRQWDNHANHLPIDIGCRVGPQRRGSSPPVDAPRPPRSATQMTQSSAPKQWPTGTEQDEQRPAGLEAGPGWCSGVPPLHQPRDSNIAPANPRLDLTTANRGPEGPRLIAVAGQTQAVLVAPPATVAGFRFGRRRRLRRPRRPAHTPQPLQQRFPPPTA